MRLLLVFLGTCLVLGCGDSATPTPTDTFVAERWSGEAKPLKKQIYAALQGTATLADSIFTPDFRAERLSGRLEATSPSPAGVRRATWVEVEAALELEALRTDLASYREALGPLQHLEQHTWQVDVLQNDAALKVLETREALWLRGVPPDGGLRQDRFLLVLRFSQQDGQPWRVCQLRIEQASSVLGPGPYFHDVTAEVLPPGYDQSPTALYTDGGVALQDFDADGDCDIFLPRLHAPARLYRNDGRGNFEDATSAVGLELNLLRSGSNCGVFFDADLDGKLDLLIGLKDKGPRLFLQREGRFVLEASAVQGGDGAWESLVVGDGNGDGLPDIFACNYGLIDTEHQPESYIDAHNGGPNHYYLNLGEGKFRLANQEAGLQEAATRWSYAACWADDDNDGDLDLYVANDYGPNNLFRNDGQGHFSDQAASLGAQDHGNGMSALFCDLDNDLDLDLYISNMQSFAGNRITRLDDFRGDPAQAELYRRFSQGNTLLLNQGNGSYSDGTVSSGTQPAFWAWGGTAFDYDADGDSDVFCAAGFYTGASARDT